MNSAVSQKVGTIKRIMANNLDLLRNKVVHLNEFLFVVAENESFYLYKPVQSVSATIFRFQTFFHKSFCYLSVKGLCQ